MSSNARSYGKLLTKSIDAIHSAIERANAINDPYYKESSIILLSNAWELLAKGLLIKHGGASLIYETGSRKERTITAEFGVNKLKNLGYINELQAAPIQQIISLRNEAMHQTLPNIADEILFHLEYYAIRYYKQTLDANFKQYGKSFRKQFLSVSFSTLTTYADKVKKLIAKARREHLEEDVRLAYLLERGVVFSGSEYIKQSEFEKVLKDPRTIRPMYKLKIGDYTRKAEMIVVVPIQAPSGTIADIKLSKSRSSNITVNIQKRSTDDDYPHLTKDLSAKLGKSLSYIQRMIKDKEIKGNVMYHQRIRSGSSSYVHKYSDSCFNYLSEFLRADPGYIPPV